MREIKFRAWDAEAEEFIYSDQRYDDAYFEFVDGLSGLELEAFRIVLKPATHEEPEHFESEELSGEPEQYTGFKDCNGVEIYEAGDVVKDSEGAVFAVEWDNLAGAWIACLPKIELLGAFNPRNIEVIGNRRQNPELLEDEHERD